MQKVKQKLKKWQNLLKNGVLPSTERERHNNPHDNQERHDLQKQRDGANPVFDLFLTFCQKHKHFSLISVKN